MNPDAPSRPTPRRRWHPALKALAALAVAAVVGVLFVQSVRDARSEPYAVSAGHLVNWTLGVDAATSATSAVVSLRPPAALPMNLLRQLFARQMESLATPSEPGIALALRRELAAGVSASEVLALARAAGFEQAALTPRCIGHRRVSEPGNTRQLYFLWFEVPGFADFRQALRAQAGPDFDPASLSPVMMMAAESGFERWLPIAVDEGRDCVAPVQAE